MHRAQTTGTIGIAVVALFVGARYSPEAQLETRLAAAEATIASLAKRLAAIWAPPADAIPTLDWRGLALLIGLLLLFGVVTLRRIQT